jgi:mono/diheme cytochrome c family protein
MAKDVVIPIEAQAVPNTLPANDETLQQGRQIYMQSCVLCHDSDGHSQTKLGQAMYPPAMDLTSPHVQSWNDGELFWIIRNGVRMTGMPSWANDLSEDDTWKVVQFIRHIKEMNALNSGPKRPATESDTNEANLVRYGRTLYRQEGCFMCHRLEGEGGKVGPDLTFEGNRGRSAEWLTGHFKNPVVFTKGSIMPSFKNLSDPQLQALVVFLQSRKKLTAQEKH